LQLAEACPHRLSKLVNIDGMPSPRPHPDVASHERTRLMRGELAGWLDFRRSSKDVQRKPGTLDELATRRGRMNPRLSHDWLRYIASVGARRDADGWRWKIDPKLRMGGFGPWRNSWSLERLGGLNIPMLGLMGKVPEQMGWGTEPEELRRFLPPGGELIAFDQVGHFVHIERPRDVADLVLEFLA
jgi:pimeloyl-ACP methyl ester carboxylesterase